MPDLRNDYVTYHMFKPVPDLKALPKGLQKNKKGILYWHKGVIGLNHFYNLLVFY